MKKTIGILGGMGPSASSAFYQKIIQYSQENYGARQDNEFPPVILYSLPLEGFNETGITDTDMVREQLIEGVQKLENAGCDMIVIACNTVNLFFHDMQDAVKVPIINIVQKTLEDVKDHNFDKIGLLASETTCQMNLYDDVFIKSGVELIKPNPDAQSKITAVIENVMGGNQGAEDKKMLLEVVQQYKEKGAQAVVMGCTEIPLVLSQKDLDFPLFDAMDAGVKYVVDVSLS